MSTVGYGDLVPQTSAGKVLGSVVVFLSMIFLALPMTIIVSKFSSCYDDLVGCFLNLLLCKVVVF